MKLLESKINFPKRPQNNLRSKILREIHRRNAWNCKCFFLPNITCAKRRTNFTAIKNDGGARDWETSWEHYALTILTMFCLPKYGKEFESNEIFFRRFKVIWTRKWVGFFSKKENYCRDYIKRGFSVVLVHFLV